MDRRSRDIGKDPDVAMAQGRGHEPPVHDESGELRTVLVVDDSAVDRMLVRGLLGRSYRLLEASTGSEGLAICQKERPHCVLLDHWLSDQNGLTLLPQFLRPGTGVVLLTGSLQQENIIAALRGGAHDYLRKSELSTPELRRAISNACDKAMLSQALDRYEQLVEYMTIGAVLCKVEGRDDPAALRCVWANASATRAAMHPLCGPDPMPRPDLAGCLLLEAFPEVRDASTTLERLEAALRTRDPQSLAQVTLGISPSAGIYELSFAPLDEHFVAILFQDVTQQIRNEEERRALLRQDSVRQRLTALGRLAGGVAHDFNNLLTVIQTHSSLIRACVSLDHPAAVHVRAVLVAAERAARLTDQLLAIGRRQFRNAQVIAPVDVIAKTMTLLRLLVRDRVDLRSELEDGVGAIEIDVGQLEQVLMNLSVNARDAMPGGGTLTIRCRSESRTRPTPCDDGRTIPPGPYVVIEVADNGSGMDASTQERIFEPFFTTKVSEGGTGLGLSTVYGIVSQNNGFLLFESEPGVGTVFRALFPRSERPVQPSLEPSGPRPPRDEVHEGTILVVDDEALIVDAAAHILETIGFDVLRADGPQVALDVARGHAGTIDLLLTDVRMPGMNGPTLAEVLRGERPTIRVLFMSGYADEVDRLSLARHRAQVVQKPFETGSLLGAVSTALEASAQVGAVVERGTAPTIAVVDDDAFVRGAIRGVLEAEEFDVLEASGLSELRGLESDLQRCAAIVCDLNLGDHSGVEVHRWLADRGSPLVERFVLVTGGTLDDDGERFVAECEGRVIKKPIRPEDLLAVLEGLQGETRAA